MEAHLAISGNLPEEVLTAATATYERTFAAPPYNEAREDAEAFAERTRRYLDKREGGRLAWVTGNDGSVAAFAVSSPARPKRWRSSRR